MRDSRRKRRHEKFLSEIEAKVELATKIWRKKVDQFRTTLKVDELEEKIGIKKMPNTFQVLLKLHCYENVIEELEVRCFLMEQARARDSHPPSCCFSFPSLRNATSTFPTP